MDDEIDNLAWQIKVRAETLPGKYKTIVSEAAMLILYTTDKDIASIKHIAKSIAKIAEMLKKED